MSDHPILPPPFRDFGQYFDVLDPKQEAVALRDLIHKLPRIRVPSDYCEIDLSFGELTLRVVRLVEHDSEAVRFALVMFAAEAYELNFSRAERQLFSALGIDAQLAERVATVRSVVRRAFGLSENQPASIAASLREALAIELTAIHRAVLTSDHRAPVLATMDEGSVRLALEKLFATVGTRPHEISA